jgi:ornithine carbamoyltransferase
MGPDRDLGVGTTPDLDATIERTRCASELAAYDQGANVSYLGPSGTQAEDRMHTIKAVPVPTLGG